MYARVPFLVFYKVRGGSRNDKEDDSSVFHFGGCSSLRPSVSSSIILKKRTKTIGELELIKTELKRIIYVVYSYYTILANYLICLFRFSVVSLAIVQSGRY